MPSIKRSSLSSTQCPQSFRVTSGWGISHRLVVALPSIRRKSSFSAQRSKSSRWEVEESSADWQWRCLLSRELFIFRSTSQSSRWEVEESSADWQWRCLLSRGTLHLPLNFTELQVRSWGIIRRLEVALPSIKRSSSSSTSRSQSSRWEVEESSTGWKWRCLRSRGTLHLPLYVHRASGERLRNHPHVVSSAAFNQEGLYISLFTLTQSSMWKVWRISRWLKWCCLWSKFFLNLMILTDVDGWRSQLSGWALHLSFPFHRALESSFRLIRYWWVALPL